jgi:hypothetical protein
VLILNIFPQVDGIVTDLKGERDLKGKKKKEISFLGTVFLY